MHNPDMLDGYTSLGEELLEQVGGPLGVFCGCVGTAGMLIGTARVLARQDPRPRIVAFEPATSAVLSGGAAGAHNVEGVSPGFVPAQYDAALVDEARGIDEQAGRAMARRLVREEGLFAGTSTGLNVVGAIELACELGAGRRVATVACDSGLKYMAGPLYAP